MIPETNLGKLRVWGFLEGISLILLLGICMPLKYVWGVSEPTQFVGAAHGGLFIIYCIWLAIVTLEIKWSFRLAMLSFVASFVPFGTFVADRHIFKKYMSV